MDMEGPPQNPGRTPQWPSCGSQNPSYRVRGVEKIMQPLSHRTNIPRFPWRLGVETIIEECEVTFLQLTFACNEFLSA